VERRRVRWCAPASLSARTAHSVDASTRCRSSMSTPSSSGSRAPSAPERGTFPLDHFHECDETKKSYFECLERNAYDASACVEASKAYLECRMSRELMTKEDFGKLGFREGKTRTAAETKTASDDDVDLGDGHRVAGLRGASARKT
jgi:cytochrome c oxidase assembly protein subunit 19